MEKLLPVFLCRPWLGVKRENQAEFTCGEKKIIGITCNPFKARTLELICNWPN